MKSKIKLAFAAVAVVILTFTWWFVQNRKANLNNGAVYARLAELDDQKENHLDLRQLQGSYFILHFWAKWCEPCADEIPLLVSFAKSAQFAKPLRVLAVSLDPSLAEAKQILPAKGEGLPANFILLLDPEHKVAEAMGSYQYPETYFIGPDGKVLEKWIGPQKWDKPEVVDFFKRKMQ
jgi:thiol-disulfide isomerase/thioredoxin